MNVRSEPSVPGTSEGRNPYLEQQRARESNARSYPRRLPVALASGQGIYVKDTDGRTYIDCLAGAGALALGHHHPVVVEALQKTLRDGVPWQTLDLTTPIKHRFIETLFATLPPELARNGKIQFCGPSGADANEAAIKLVKTATGRRSVLSFHGGYHGMTHATLALTGHLDPKAPLPGLMPEAHFLPYPYAYRCPFGVGQDAGQRLSSAYIERTLKDPNSGITAPAGMIFEPVQGEGGVIPAPDEWMRELRRITAEQQVPLILDEVQTGLGRTGAVWACNHADVVPDVLVLSKAIGGGLPLSVIVYKAELDRWASGAHAGTFRGNQLAMAAGAAAIAFVHEERLDQHAHSMGERLSSCLRRTQAGSPCMGEVRGRGLMIGVEIVDPQGVPDRCGSLPADPARAQRIQAGCLRRGLIVELGGRHGCVLRFLPPLIVSPDEIDAIASIFEEAVLCEDRRS